MKIKNIVHIQTIEGREKPAYNKVGVLLIKDDGKVSIKLNSVPVGEWNGWLNVYDQQDKQETPKSNEPEPF